MIKMKIVAAVQGKSVKQRLATEHRRIGDVLKLYHEYEHHDRSER